MKYPKIKKAIDSGLLSQGLCEIISAPDQEAIKEAEANGSFKFSEDHIHLLLEWGGSNLDEIRINGLAEIGYQANLICFANDYNGYSFAYDSEGNVFSIDSGGGYAKKLTNSVSEFINEYLFGESGEEFYGKEWVAELREFGFA